MRVLTPMVLSVLLRFRFTLALNIRIGPKTARAKDVQEEITVQPGSLYVIKSEVSTPKVLLEKSACG